jgi:hypothetical protein
MIKEQVHHFILKIYFFVLDAYNRSEYGSFRERVLEKTLSGAQKAGHVVGSVQRKVDSAKEKVHHLGERVSEKTHLGHHGHSHSDERDHRTFSREHMLESRTQREEDRAVRGWSEGEMFEERFVAPRERIERAAIREEHATTDAPRGRSGDATFRDERIREERLAAVGGREASFREERTRGEREASRNRQASATFREDNIRTTTAAARPQPQQRMNPSTAVALSTGSLVGAPPVPLAKSMEKVSHWRDKVAEETAMAAAAAVAVNNDARVTTKHEVLDGARGERIDRTITTRETTLDQRRPGQHHHRRPVSREPSMTSGQTYRSAAGGTGRTSLMVHPPSSVRERIIGQREEWTEDARIPSARRMMGGGDVGVNGEVRRSGESKVWK